MLYHTAENSRDLAVDNRFRLRSSRTELAVSPPPRPWQSTSYEYVCRILPVVFGEKSRIKEISPSGLLPAGKESRAGFFYVMPEPSQPCERLPSSHWNFRNTAKASPTLSGTFANLRKSPRRSWLLSPPCESFPSSRWDFRNPLHSPLKIK
jgi:hypothetical protein